MSGIPLLYWALGDLNASRERSNQPSRLSLLPNVDFKGQISHGT